MQLLQLGGEVGESVRFLHDIAHHTQGRLVQIGPLLHELDQLFELQSKGGCREYEVLFVWVFDGVKNRQ